MSMSTTRGRGRPPATRRERVERVARDLFLLTDEQFEAIAKLVKAIADDNHPEDQP